MNRIAKIINNFRVFPRMMIVYYMALSAVVAYQFMFMLDDPTVVQGSFSTAIVTAGAIQFGWYVKSGKVVSLDDEVDQ